MGHRRAALPKLRAERDFIKICQVVGTCTDLRSVTEEISQLCRNLVNLEKLLATGT